MKEHDRFLTITPIEMILQYDTPVEHSDLACKLIDEVKSQLGIEIVCCYAQITRLLSFEDEETIKNSNKFIKKYRNSIPPHFFTDRTAMSLCVRGSLSQVKALDKDESVKKAVAQIYSDLLKTERISIEYKRAYSQLELKYYGYLNKPQSECDMSKVIPVDSTPKEEISVSLDSFDSLMRWHVLSRTRNRVSQHDVLRKYYAKAYVGWDKEIWEENHYILFDSKERLDRFFEEKLNESIIPELLEIIGKSDKWNIINIDNYSPIFVLESSLSPEKMFELLRG